MGSAARSWLDGIIDYAGVFPPAALPVPAAVAEYAAASSGPDRGMLGRFVLPAARLEEFAAARGAAGPAAPAWPLSVIVRDRAAQDVAAIERFAAAAAGLGSIEAVEGAPADPAGIDWLAETVGEGRDVYVEIPLGAGIEPWLERLRARRLRAKVRTGGVTADSFPPPVALVDFLAAAVRLGVPFKATAGLHHAVRGCYPLTYDAGAPAAPMYGYLNVLLATAALAAGHPADVAHRLLVCDTASTLELGPDAVRWADVVLPAGALARARSAHLLSFGSCSFREPTTEYRTLAPRD